MAPGPKEGANDSHLEDTKTLVPGLCHSGIFKGTVCFCTVNSASDVATMGSVPYVSLMALTAKEYASPHARFRRCQ